VLEPPRRDAHPADVNPSLHIESDPALDLFAQLIDERTGLRFHNARRRFLATRLAEAASEVGAGSLQELYEMVRTATRNGGREGLFQLVVDRIVTDESSFFRYPGQFEALRNFIFPAIASHREFTRDNSVRILSAGCSRGQEPYSLAISACEEVETLRGLDVTVYALDLSQNVLDIARQGIYEESQVRDVSPRQLDRYFQRLESGRRAARYQVKPEVRNMVRFQQHNLLSDLPGPIFDIVFCRNVTIYFNEETTRRVARNLYDRLRPGGYLYLGHAESYYGILPELTIVQFGDVLVNRKPIPR